MIEASREFGFRRKWLRSRLTPGETGLSKLQLYAAPESPLSNSMAGQLQPQIPGPDLAMRWPIIFNQNIDPQHKIANFPAPITLL
ncbi:MAG: hypothetical protein K2X59_07855 [Sphingomonas sp.]|nr:hypothetical protein [Sphingomonas sp.]